MASVESLLTVGFLPNFWIVFGVPLFQVLLVHFRGEAERVVAGIIVRAGLRRMTQLELAGIEDPLRSHEARQLRGLTAEVEADVDRNPVIIEEHGVEVRHIAAVFETENTAQGSCRAGN